MTITPIDLKDIPKSRYRRFWRPVGTIVDYLDKIVPPYDRPHDKVLEQFFDIALGQDEKWPVDLSAFLMSDPLARQTFAKGVGDIASFDQNSLIRVAYFTALITPEALAGWLQRWLNKILKGEQLKRLG